ncbi:MAG: alkaline phosphatase family protein [Acidimicrobiia bacterium]
MIAMDRRRFLTLGAGAAVAAALAACSSDSSGSKGATRDTGRGRQPRAKGLGDPKQAPFDHVVLLMMENRSFDHLLGWLPGADGKQAGLSYPGLDGKQYKTHDLGTKYQGCEFLDPQHQWPAGVADYNDGKGDGFLFGQVNEGEKAPADLFPIGYYGKAAVPILGTLAEQYTTFDRYFAALNAGTWPNRIYQVAAAPDIDYTGLILPDGTAVPQSQIQTTIWDRLTAAGLTGGYYAYGEPMTAVFASGKYADITHPIDDFFTACKQGTLPNLTLVEPDFTTASEGNGTSNDDHPWGDIRVGEGFIRKVYDAVTRSPQWSRTVLVINFDEWGGFYDHVLPPKVQDDNVNPNPGSHPDYKQLGFRVPCVVVSPWSPRTVVTDGPYEHCSILRMVEWRWGLEPMTLRDRSARNLAETLDFSLRRPPVALPKFTAPAPVACPPGSGAS